MHHMSFVFGQYYKPVMLDVIDVQCDSVLRNYILMQSKQYNICGRAEEFFFLWITACLKEKINK